ncbi:MAG: type II toxin-antitoxin system RelE/ParE family toxin [Rhodocyclaceae bacterium]|jgi:toxin ParE1/3/4|nr:type II toxin-antitoxin system RelE/ParE family toxin [Rhodocyclaceae bacterium]MBK6908631.1 type II toxin-antitoxin system RelE/ParE family toxin [Rhodocyclaceae bacterium]
MRVEFHPEALAEFRAATKYYEQQQTGLGERFANVVEMAVAHIAAAPESFRIIEDDIRRCLAKVFPYAVLYSIEPDNILIVAVMHCRREPGYWRNRS